MTEQSLTISDPAQHRVSAVLASPDAGADRVVLLCHGFLSNKNSSTNKSLTRALVERNIATFRFDFFGQGESEGPFERITLTTAVGQAHAALQYLKDHRYRRIGIVGSSFGGLVGILATAQSASGGPPIAALGLKCPVPDFPEMLRQEFGPEGMERWRTGDIIPDVTGGAAPVRLDYAFYEDCLRYDAYKSAESIVAPTLIVQGDQDEYVPLDQSRRLHDALSGPKHLAVVPGADHSFTKADDFHRMTTLLIDWMCRHLDADAEGG